MRSKGHQDQDQAAGADAIYATNNNRRFATKYGIRTDFKRKGRAGRHEKQRERWPVPLPKNGRAVWRAVLVTRSTTTLKG
ncbi:MAG: hypothetical protein R2814_16500 [Flavobacteriaceae bacterium]